MKKRWKNEWHLLSAVSIGSFIAFLCFNFTDGTPQHVGVAFSTIVLAFLMKSDNWRIIDTSAHKCVVIAMVVLLLIISTPKIIKNYE